MLAARIDGGSYADINLASLKEELTKEEITVAGEGNSFPLKVTAGKYKFTIDNDGNVEKIAGIDITEKTVKLLKGESKTLTTELEDGIEGTIIWTSSDSDIVTIENGTVKAVAESGKATITAKIRDTNSGLEYQTTATVNIAKKVTRITAENITVTNGKTAQLQITTEPEGIVEDLTYTSSDETKATVEDGVVTAKASGEVTITIAGKTSTDVKTTCTVTIEKARVAVTAAQIAANPEKYYGQEVKNYTAGGKTYRIFYVDTAGDFGAANTIYLKADWSSNDTSLSSYTSYTPKTTDILEKMNSDWWASRGAASWNANEHCAAYLCDPTTEESTSNQAWSSYFDSQKANYVIGSPSVEMYVKSYNQVSHTVGNYTLGATYRATSFPGYIYALNGAQSTLSNNDYWTGTDSLDYSAYNSMYCGKNGSKGSYYTWLASPSAGDSGYVYNVDGDCADLGSGYYNGTYGVSPLVSLQSGILPEIEE